MKPLERIGTWLQKAGIVRPVVTKGSQVTQPIAQQITQADDLYALVYGLGTFNDVHPITAYRLYLKSDILGTVVHRIAHEIAGMQFGITTDGQDFEDNVDVVRFLNASSEGYSKRRFFYELAVSYLLTNEAWPVLRGRVGRPPVARTWVYPFDVIDDQSDTDGLPVAFRTIGDRDRRVYFRTEQGMQLRFVDDDEANELIPILGSEAINRPYRGQSQLAQLYYAISQNVEGKRHNTSMLRNGLRTTGGVMPVDGEYFSEDAVRDIQAAFQAMRGSATAGGTLVMPKPVQLLELAVSNQEMDYINLIAEGKETVYNFYGIPLPLMTNDSATFNNFATAQTAFFDTAVLPVVDDILDALTAGLAPRFPELRGSRLTYNENTIRALRGRNLKRMGDARGTNALSTNEIRQMGGFEEVEGGDDVLVPSTLVPSGDMSGMQFPGSGQPIDTGDDIDPGEVDNNIQQTALNGAQVQALVEILTSVRNGDITGETARALISAAFPGIPEHLVESMLNGIAVAEAESAIADAGIVEA